jgi:hypothetical protein
MRTIIAIFGFMLFSNSIFSQPIGNFATLDQKSYQLYLEGNHKELNKLGKQMIESGTDYYYLRMRLGISAFNRQRYATAIEHFKKALAFNSSDTLAHEYIFFGYIYSGRNADALYYRETIPIKMQSANVRNYELTGINFLSVKADYTVNNSPTVNYTLVPSNQNYVGENIDYTYGLNIKTTWLKASKWNYTFSYNYLSKSGVTYNEFFPTGVPSDFSQHQLYFRTVKNIYEGFELQFFGTMAFYSGASTYGRVRMNRIEKQLANDYLAGIGFAKRTKHIRFDINASYSNLVGFNQIRGEGYITIYPFENSKFYSIHGGIFQYDFTLGNGYNAFSAIGFKLLKPVGMELGINIGNAMLSARNSGEMLINSLSQPKWSTYGNINTSFGKGFYFSLTGFVSETSEFIWNSSLNTKINPKQIKYIGANIKLIKYF